MFIRYTVKPGDTLSAIAKEQLGDAKRLNEITNEELNPIANPNLIRPNQVLVLPDDFHGMNETAGEYIVGRDESDLNQIVAKLYTGGAERLASIVASVLGLNSLGDGESLWLGQRLKMPKVAGLKNEMLQPIVDPPSASMASFDVTYNHLYQALENAVMIETWDAAEKLLNFCQRSIESALMAWSDLSASQEGQPLSFDARITGRSWQHFLADSDALVQSTLLPIAGRFPGGNEYEKGMSLIKADLLRGRFAQISRLSAMQQGIINVLADD